MWLFCYTATPLTSTVEWALSDFVRVLTGVLLQESRSRQQQVTQIFSTSTVMFINNRRAVGFNNKIVSSVSVSRFDGHFPGGPGLAGTRMSPFWTLLELRVMVVVTVGAVRCAKLRSEFHHQQTNTQFFTGWMPFLSPYQQCQSTEGKI